MRGRLPILPWSSGFDDLYEGLDSGAISDRIPFLVDRQIRFWWQRGMGFFTQFLADLVHFRYQLDDNIGERVADFLWIGDDHALTVAQDNVPWHPDHGGVVGHAAKYYRVCPNATIFTDSNIPQHAGAGTDHDVVANCGMPLTLLFAGSSQGHALVQGHIIADYSGLANHDTHTVINKQAAPNFRAGVDLYACNETCQLRIEARQETKTVLPKPVAEMMAPHRVQAGVAEQDFEIRPCRRVALEDACDVFSDRL